MKNNEQSDEKTSPGLSTSQNQHSVNYPAAKWNVDFSPVPVQSSTITA